MIETMEHSDIPPHPIRTRVLQATRELIIAHGAKRFTVSDVAARAGVGKGTLYLHWPSKDELVLACVAEDVIHSLDHVVAEIHQDATALRPSRLAVSLLRAQQQRPLLRTAIEDPEVTRLLARHASTHPSFSRTTPMAMAAGMVPLLRSGGLIRTDLDTETQTYALHAIMAGSAVTPEATAPAVDPERALASALVVLLEPATLAVDTEWDVIARAVLDFLARARAQLSRIVTPLDENSLPGSPSDDAPSRTGGHSARSTPG